MSTIDKIEKTFNSALTKRLLVQYFVERGFGENFDKRTNPIMLQDLAHRIPQLHGLVEVEAHAKDIDPTTGWCRLAWNLFVLGNQRMYLGETEHDDIKTLHKYIEEGSPILVDDIHGIKSRQERSARDIVHFIARTLGKSDAGRIRNQGPITPALTFSGGQGSDMWEKPKTARPEGRMGSY